MNKDVVVIIGAGGIGQAIARRQGAGRQVLLADYNEQALTTAKDSLRGAGFEVSTHPVDVSKRESVHVLARAAAELGPVVNVVNTAGLSPVQASASAVLAVDLVGTALVLEEFGAVIAPGGAGLVIASMAGHMPRRWTSSRRTPSVSRRRISCSNCPSSASRPCPTRGPPTPSRSRPITPASRPPR